MNEAVMPSPAQVMLWLDAKAKELDALGKELEAAHLAEADAEVVYIGERDGYMKELVDEYVATGKRLPGEDARDAIIRTQMDFDIYANWRIAQAQVKALEGHVRRLEAAVTARQSTLNAMRELDRLPSFDTNTGELIGGRR